ncbi:hypothetical protein BT69DRAFT_1139741 [Atractiella rhizophila]|nr:hypothetical protein BT69DRAFT_1139741 [Atractiella rhizophila]
MDSLPVEAEVTATEEKVEVDSKAVEKELEDNVAIAPTLEEVQTESTQNKTVVVPIEFVEETSSVLDASSKANEEVESTALPTSSNAEVEGYEIPVTSNSIPADVAVEQCADVEMTNADSKENEEQRDLDDYADSSVSHGDDIATDDRMSAGVVIEPESVGSESQEREKEDDDEVLSDLSSEDEASGKEDGEYYVVA